jgi:hypothetical protein
LKKTTAIFTTSLLILTGSQISNAASYDPVLDPLPNGYASISIVEEASVMNASQINVQPPAPDENLVRGDWIICDTLDDEECDYSKPSNDIMGAAILPLCESAIDENCIEPLEIIVSGSPIVGVHQGYVETQLTYESNPELNFYEALAPSIFSVPGATHQGGSDTYVVSARATVRYKHELGYFMTEDLTTSVIPISTQPRSNFANGGVGCFQLDETTCGVAEDFAKNVRVRVSVRLADEVGGWFFGRMKDPAINSAAFSSTNNRIVVEAEPVDVPRLNVKVPQDSLSLEDRRAIGNSGTIGVLGDSDKVYIQTQAFDKTVFRFIEYYRSWVNDTAAGTTSLWSFKTIANGPGNQCLADKTKVLGIVTTNSMGYDGNSPAYENGFLNYNVAGLHYAPDGQNLNLGTYDLVMRSDTARCLYGFSRAPVSATVTVVGSDGEENVATTVVSERDGWLKLAAYGFTFSEKEIKVRVTQPQTRTLTAYSRTATSLTAKQKAEIRATVTKGAANPKFICTGIRLEGQPQALNTLVRKRAKAACDYAKSLNPKLSTFFQTKTTKAPSFNGKVLVVSK